MNRFIVVRIDIGIIAPLYSRKGLNRALTGIYPSEILKAVLRGLGPFKITYPLFNN